MSVVFPSVSLPHFTKVGVVLATSLLLSACGGGLTDVFTPAAPSGGTVVGASTAPRGPSLLAPEEEEFDCPAVSIAPGGAAVRIGAAGSETVRSQITITDVVRECVRGPDGIIMRVGAEGRVLVGPAGSAGALGATMRIDVRKGAQTLSSRTARVGASIPAGQASASWVHVEQGIVIPASAFRASGDLDVFVTLNPGASPARRRR